MGRMLTDSQSTISALNFSHRRQFLFIKMSKAYVVIAGVKVCVVDGSATVVGLVSGDDVIVPSSAFFPSLAASLRVANIGPDSLKSQPIMSIVIPRNAESPGYHVFRIVNHFHQFHLRTILD
jgi:hypothetical protein